MQFKLLALPAAVLLASSFMSGCAGMEERYLEKRAMEVNKIQVACGFDPTPAGKWARSGHLINKIEMGFTGKCLDAQHGKSYTVNTSVTKALGGGVNTSEQRVYSFPSSDSPKYVYLENGVVTGWQFSN
jgi:hypothetical protein